MDFEANMMSIGALSRATGIPTDTLRTWERRYGFPRAERTPSGHRRYSMKTLERLRLVTRVLELGHRPSTVLAADQDSLLHLLAATKGKQAPPERADVVIEATPDAHEEAVNAWLGHVERYEGRALERELRNSWAALGALPFLECRAGPFVQELGRRWEGGALSVGHEHFASERLREFLVQRWRPLSDAATGPSMVLATLPGEQHVLGLHMAAIALALGNVRIVFLGADSPPVDIARAVAHHAAEAIALSASKCARTAETAAHVAALRNALPAHMRIVAGGAGFDPPPDGVHHTPSFTALCDWLSRV